MRHTVRLNSKYILCILCTLQARCLFTKHKLLRAWKPTGAPITAQLCKTKHQLQKWSPLNAYKHIKHGCLHCPSMTAFMGGVHNERLGVQRDNATSRAIITQVCGWDEGSKAACATGMPLLCCRPCCQKITGFISGRIKRGLRINEFLNTQHHLHKKQQAGYVGGRLYFNLNAQSERDAGVGAKRSGETQTKQSKSTFQLGFVEKKKPAEMWRYEQGMLSRHFSGAEPGVYWY